MILLFLLFILAPIVPGISAICSAASISGVFSGLLALGITNMNDIGHLYHCSICKYISNTYINPLTKK